MSKYVVKFLPILALLLLTQSSFAQQNKREKRAQKVLIFGAVELGHHRNSINPISEQNSFNYVSADKVWNERSSNSAELKIGMHIKKNLYLVSGVRYKQQSLSRFDVIRSFTHEIDNYTVGSDANNGRDINLKSIEIPIEIRSDIHISRFTIAPSFGISAGVNVHQEQSLFVADDSHNIGADREYVSVEKIETDNKINLYTSAKLELAYSFKNRTKIKVGAFHNYYLRDEIILNEDVELGLHNYGLQVGFEVPLAFECPYKNYYGF